MGSRPSRLDTNTRSLTSAYDTSPPAGRSPTPRGRLPSGAPLFCECGWAGGLSERLDGTLPVMDALQVLAAQLRDSAIQLAASSPGPEPVEIAERIAAEQQRWKSASGVPAEQESFAGFLERAAQDLRELWRF